ncbi:MAG: hypothetical protein KGZ82_15520 [Bacteroidales bacterium]|nr:hypothetical protein [Bacteroidales bacterium]
MQAWFASPDPFIPDATATQSYNRYSYCINNPLKYTDPSGYIDKPADWNKGNSGALYVNPNFNAGYTHIGPGSGNHWSDQYRTPYFNFMIGSPDGFDRIYGIGAWATALSVITNPNLEWVSGEGKKPGIYVKEVKYHFNGWKGDISSGFTADGESEVINRFIPFSGRENGETPKGQGGGIIVGQSVDATAALVSFGYTIEGGYLTDGKNVMQFVSRGKTYGLEASVGYNLTFIFPKSNFKFSDLKGMGTSGVYNFGPISISIMGNASPGYPENSVFDSYWGIKIGIGAGSGGSYTPDSNTTPLNWLPDISQSFFHWK